MRSIVENFVAKMSPEEKNLLEKKLSQKGHAVTNENGDRPTSKQTYMLHNEAQAYLLESGSCVDGAFMSYEDDEATSPDRVIPKTAPLVVKYSAKLRKELIDAGVFAREWADHWSPDVVRNKGCKG